MTFLPGRAVPVLLLQRSSPPEEKARPAVLGEPRIAETAVL